MSTHALDRATEANYAKHDEHGRALHGGPLIHLRDLPDWVQECWEANTRAAVSAALHDPDDPDFGAKAIHARDVQSEVATRTWDELPEHAREGYREDFDAVRAAILGGA